MKYLGAPQSGSQANTTASRNRAGQYYRNRRSPVQPVGTGRRAIVRAAFGAASSAYATLTAAQQAAWSAYAATTPYTDKLGQALVLTGHQMFVAISTQLQNVGLPISNTPPASSTVFSQGLVTLSAMADGTVILFLAGAGAPADFSLVAFSAPQSGGVSFCKNFNQFDFVAGDDTDSLDYTGQFAAQFGIAPANSRIFYSMRPVNQFGVGGVPVIGFISVAPTVVGAVATAGLTGVVNWTFSGADPALWLVQESDDGGVTWNFNSTVGGTVRTQNALTPGVKIRIVGLNSDNTIAYAASNAVTIV